MGDVKPLSEIPQGDYVLIIRHGNPDQGVPNQEMVGFVARTEEYGVVLADIHGNPVERVPRRKNHAAQTFDPTEVNKERARIFNAEHGLNENGE